MYDNRALRLFVVRVVVSSEQAKLAPIRQPSRQSKPFVEPIPIIRSSYTLLQNYITRTECQSRHIYIYTTGSRRAQKLPQSVSASVVGRCSSYLPVDFSLLFRVRAVAVPCEFFVSFPALPLQSHLLFFPFFVYVHLSSGPQRYERFIAAGAQRPTQTQQQPTTEFEKKTRSILRNNNYNLFNLRNALYVNHQSKTQQISHHSLAKFMLSSLELAPCAMTSS